ncbi:hypothetical protein GGD83_001168 [Rhodoblastus sphagnicola]|nr:hypothetical protein [Rhodoblastus sphagnicola]
MPPVLARAAARPAPADDEEPETPEASAELVPLEEADPASEKDAAVVDDDVDLGDDDVADDTFLEEEEEDNDDVADLIDGDIETDDEG